MHGKPKASVKQLEIAETADGPYFNQDQNLKKYPPLRYGDKIIPQDDPRHEVLAELSLLKKLVHDLREGISTSIDKAIKLVDITVHDIFEATRHHALLAAANPYLAQAKNPDTMHEGLNGLVQEWIPEVEAHVGLEDVA